jgi:hypothetical protein
MKMNSRFRYMYDAAPLARLRARGAGAITATATETALNLDQLDGYWTAAFHELADQAFAVVANVTAVDHGTGDETYKLEVVTENGVVVATTVVKAPGQYVLFVDTGTLRAADPAAVTIAVKATLGGTTPSLDYFAWLGKHLDD